MSNHNLILGTTTDVHGRTVRRWMTPEEAAKAQKMGAGWKGGTPAAPASRAAVVSSPPTPSKPFSSLAALADARTGEADDFLADGTHYSAKTSASKKQLSDFLHSLRSSVADPERVWTDAPRNPETGVSDEAYTYEVTDDAIKVHVERHVFPTDYNLFEPLAEPWAPVIRASEDEGYARKLFANGFEAALDEIEASVHDSVESLVVEGGVAMHPFDMERLWGDRESPFSSATRTREYIADELDVPVADVIASDEELRDLFVVDVDYTFYSLDDGAVELELRKAFKQWEFDNEDGSE